MIPEGGNWADEEAQSERMAMEPDEVPDDYECEPEDYGRRRHQRDYHAIWTHPDNYPQESNEPE